MDCPDLGQIFVNGTFVDNEAIRIWVSSGQESRRARYGGEYLPGTHLETNVVQGCGNLATRF